MGGVHRAAQHRTGGGKRLTSKAVKVLTVHDDAHIPPMGDPAKRVGHLTRLRVRFSHLIAEGLFYGTLVTQPVPLLACSGSVGARVGILEALLIVAKGRPGRMGHPR